jgi:hypothetical protein
VNLPARSSLFYFSTSDSVAKPSTERVLTPAELADYISYARQRCTPELSDAAADKLVQGAWNPLPQLLPPRLRTQTFPQLPHSFFLLFLDNQLPSYSGYMDMRSAGISSKVIAATPRQLESLIRLSEAHAKMRCSEEVCAWMSFSTALLQPQNSELSFSFSG